MHFCNDACILLTVILAFFRKYFPSTKYLKCCDPHYGFGHAHSCACHQDFIPPFSCKGRGLCRSCNQRNMVETAAHLIENVIPIISVRQWVITFLFRIRHFFKTDAILRDVLHIIADEVHKRIIICSQNQSTILNAQFGAVTFIQLKNSLFLFFND